MNPAEVVCTKPPGAYRAIHTADWHLGKALGNLDRTTEYQRFLHWLEATLIETEADVLIIAGDVFDSATPPQSAVQLYFEFLASLHQKRGECRVVVTSGNHDSPAHLDAPRELLNLIGVQVCATLPRHPDATPAPERLLIPLPSPAAPHLLVAALPFLRERDLRKGELGQDAAAISRDLQAGIVARYQEAVDAARPWLDQGLPLLATGHLTALGATSSASERDIHVGGLGSIGADAFPAAIQYVALGHLHRPQAVGGRAHIRYSGSPITLSFSECQDRKEIRVLDFVGAELVNNLSLPVPQARHLIELRLPETELASGLRDFTPPPAPLPAWVELTILDAKGDKDLVQAAHLAAQGREQEFEIIRVLTERTAPLPLLGESNDENLQENVLAAPRAVFQQRLKAEAYDEPTHAALTTAFEELYSLLGERQRGS